MARCCIVNWTSFAHWQMSMGWLDILLGLGFLTNSGPFFGDEMFLIAVSKCKYPYQAKNGTSYNWLLRALKFALT